MSPLHLPTLTLLLLTTLSALLPFTDAGGRTSPADFSQVCVTDTHAGEFPESQLTLANLDFYGDLTETDTLTTVNMHVHVHVYMYVDCARREPGDMATHVHVLHLDLFPAY